MDAIGNELWFIKLKSGEIMCISKTEKENYSKFIDIKENDIIQYVNLSDPTLSSDPTLLPIETLQAVKECYKIRQMPIKTDKCLTSLSLINQRLTFLTDYYISPLEYDICYKTKNLYKSTYTMKIDSIVQEKLNYGVNIENYFYYLRILVQSRINSVDHFYLIVVNTSFNVIKNIYVYDTAYYPSFENLWLKRTILLYFRKTNIDKVYDNPLTFQDIDNFNNIHKINEQYKILSIQTLENQLIKTGYCSAWSTYFIWRSAVKKESHKEIYDNLAKLTPIERLSLIMIWWSLVENSITWKYSNSEKTLYTIQFDNTNYFDLGGDFKKEKDVLSDMSNKIKKYNLDKDYKHFYIFYNIKIDNITLNKALKNGIVFFQTKDPLGNIIDFFYQVRTICDAYIEEYEKIISNKYLYDLIINYYKVLPYKNNNILIYEDYINIILKELENQIEKYNKILIDNDYKNNSLTINKFINLFNTEIIKKQKDTINFTELIEIQNGMETANILYFASYFLKDIYQSIVIYIKMIIQIFDLMVTNLYNYSEYLQFLDSIKISVRYLSFFRNNDILENFMTGYNVKIPDNIQQIANLISFELPTELDD